MDEYLIEGASYERLEREYEKHQNLVVGVDFDSTIHDYHKKGHTYDLVKQLLRDLKKLNCTIICWTAYEKHDYVREFFESNNLPLDGINTDGIKLPWETRKPFFNVLIDDRAGLKSVYEDLRKLADHFLTKN